MIATRVPDINKYWPMLKWAFDKFEDMADGDITAEELRGDVIADEAQAWAVVDDNNKVKAVALTRIVGPGRRVWVEYCAGKDRKGWQHVLMGEIEAFAKSEQSVGVKMVVRRGWTPFLKELGYRETHEVMEKRYG